MKKLFYLKYTFRIFFLFTLGLGLSLSSCEPDEDKCQQSISETRTWLAGQGDAITHIGGSGFNTNFNFFGGKIIGMHALNIDDICPSKNVYLKARIVATDGHFTPAVDYVRAYWRSDLGFIIEIKDYFPVPKTADNIWEGTVDIGHFANDLWGDYPGHLEAWIDIQFSGLGSFQNDLVWLNEEFSNVSLTVEYVKF